MKKPCCSLCGSTAELSGIEGGFVCESCAETNRLGRDTTTRQTKLQQTALRGKAQQARLTAIGATIAEDLRYDTESADLLSEADSVACPPLVCGEVAAGLVETLQAPGVAAIDASVERLALVSQIGVDATALAVDASDSVQAGNSLEKMLAHQLAVCHKTALQYVAKANLQPDPQNSVRLMTLAIRAMAVFQDGMVALKRVRASGQQQIRIEHVHVQDGGQVAIVSGQSAPGAGGRK